jgi:hypothetical protein
VSGFVGILLGILIGAVLGWTAIGPYDYPRTEKDKYDTQSKPPLNPPGPRRECDCPDCMEPGLR